MNLMIVPGILVCISFLISVCMFIVSKALIISSATVIVRAGGAILLNPFVPVLFTVCIWYVVGLYAGDVTGTSYKTEQNKCGHH